MGRSSPRGELFFFALLGPELYEVRQVSTKLGGAQRLEDPQRTSRTNANARAREAEATALSFS